MKKSKRKGFTLIELLVVIIILAILIIIAVASIVVILNRTKKNTYVIEANQIVGAVKDKAVTDESILPKNSEVAKYILLSDIELQSGTGTKSSYSNAYNESSYVKIEKGTVSGVYKYSICLVDNKGNGIEETNIDDVTRSSITTEVECNSYHDGNDVNTSILLHGEDFTDSSLSNNSIVNHNVTVSTTKSKFGNSSLYFNGTSSFLDITNDNLPDGDSQFTVDMWINIYSDGSTALLGISPLGSNSNPNEGGTLFINPSIGITSGNVSYYASESLIYKEMTTSKYVWHHIALVYDGTILKVYIDGVALNSTYTYNFTNLQWRIRTFIGANSIYDYGSNFFWGYIDEIRISNIARWTSNFTPPTRAYS